MNRSTIAIIGSGTWATTLAQVLADNQYLPVLYTRRATLVDEINQNHTNSKYFNDLKLNPSIKATTDLKSLIENAEYVVIALPTAYIKTVLDQIKPLLKHKVFFINASKGFDPQSNLRISELIRRIIPSAYRHPVVSLIGPGHAEETILRQLTTSCAVSVDQSAATEIQKLFSNHYLRVYTLNDEVGAEYAVALKNVIAVASGILSGLGYGDNTRAALITRGLAEMVRYGTAKGGQLETYLGLTGIGDLIVTCSSEHSRNFQAGYAIGKSNQAEDFLKANLKTVEGIRSCEVIYQDACTHSIEMPIVTAVYQVLYQHQPPKKVIEELMMRPLKSEFY